MLPHDSGITKIGEKLMENNTNGETMEMPMGMAMSMAANPAAMNTFCRLTDGEQREIIGRARTVKSREEMTKIVEELAMRQ